MISSITTMGSLRPVCCVTGQTKRRTIYSTSSYEDLLSKAGKCLMKMSRLRTLCIEIYKTVSKLNPPFMQDIFKLKQTTRSARNPNELIHYRSNQVTFGSKSLLSLGPQIWNALPKEIKLAENIQIFKRMLIFDIERNLCSLVLKLNF